MMEGQMPSLKGRMITDRAVLIGGNGNLGREMQRELLARSDDVTVLDRGGEPIDPRVTFKRFALGTDGIGLLTDLLRDQTVVYCMVTPDVQRGTRDMFEATNHQGVKMLVEACKLAGVERLVYTSSIATTNHFVHSRNADEFTPQPPWSTYKSAYDLTKRLGEEAVLSANGDGLATCALRPGGIMASLNDYTFRNLLKGNRVPVVSGFHKIDFIAAPDLCRAHVLAADKLRDAPSGVAGEVFFVTKAKGMEAGKEPTPTDISREVARLSGRKTMKVYGNVVKGVSNLARLRYNLARLVVSDAKMPGVPFHMFARIPFYEQTFDNSKAREVLGFEPTITWQDMAATILEQLAPKFEAHVTEPEPALRLPTGKAWNSSAQVEL